MKLLLTSNGLCTDAIKNELVSLVNNDLSKKVAVVTTASPGRHNDLYPQLSKQAFLDLGFDHVFYHDFEVDKTSLLFECGIIFLCGGDPYELLHYMKISEADRYLRSQINTDLVVVGNSAGTVVLGSNLELVEFITPSLRPDGFVDDRGVGLIKDYIMVHADNVEAFDRSPDFDLHARIQEFCKLYKCPVLMLKDHDYCVYYL